MTTRPRRHAIRNRLLLSMTSTVALGVAMTAIVFVASAVTTRNATNATARLDALHEAAHELEAGLLTQESAVYDFALSGRVEAIDAFDAASAGVTRATAELAAAVDELPAIAGASETAAHAVEAWQSGWAEPFLRLDPVGRIAVADRAVAESQVLFRPAADALGLLIEEIETQRDVTRAEADNAIERLAIVIVPLGLSMTVLLAVLGLWLTRSISGPLGRLSGTVQALVAGESVTFRAERDDELGDLAVVLERLRVEAGERYDLALRESQHAGTFNQLAELTSFARDESDLVLAASRAVRRLIPTTGGDILLANPSQNRLTVGVAWGTDPAEPGTLVTIDRIDRCPGIRRSSAFVAPNVADDMAVRCPAHTAASGAVACVPMLALGKIVGVIHLESAVVAAFDPEAIALVTRVAESTGLAMANARLMNTMEGQAMSDPLTGLHNTRFFDPYLEQELEAARRDGQPLSVMMIDIDHFKAFNDTHGHPAGDEALRAFARVVRASIRASDVAARYGGEEFIVALRHASLDEAVAVAEKLRAAVEQLVVELGPGRYARITASFGVAAISATIQDQKSLVSLADAALYRAKERGRNRVEVTPPTGAVVDIDDAGRRRRSRPAVTGTGTVEPTAG